MDFVRTFIVCVNNGMIYVTTNNNSLSHLPGKVFAGVGDVVQGRIALGAGIARSR